MVSLLIYMHRLFTEKCALVSAGGILTHVPNSSPSLPPPNGREAGREGGREEEEDWSLFLSEARLRACKQAPFGR